MINKKQPIGKQLGTDAMKKLTGGILLPEECRHYGEPCRRNYDCCTDGPVLVCRANCCLPA